MIKRGAYDQENSRAERDQGLNGRLVERVNEGFGMRVITLLAFPRSPSWRVSWTSGTHELELVGFPSSHTDISHQHPKEGFCEEER